MNFRAALVLVLTGLMISWTPPFGSIHLAHASDALSLQEHDRLRRRLETLFNEQDLMIKNQKVDRGDIQHQLKEFEALKVFDRIPFKEDVAGLQKDLQTTAAERGLKVIQFKRLPRFRSASQPLPQPVPKSLFTDDPRFELTDEQLVDTLPFRMIVQGNEPAIQSWIESWAEDQLRLTEPEGKTASKAMKKLQNDRWEVRAHAFRFREIAFPRLKARDPLNLLPHWALRQPAKFAAAEPLLWNFVTRIQAIAPEAKPLYRSREELLLNSSRMSFYMGRGISRPERQQAGKQSSAQPSLSH